VELRSHLICWAQPYYWFCWDWLGPLLIAMGLASPSCIIGAFGTGWASYYWLQLDWLLLEQLISNDIGGPSCIIDSIGWTKCPSLLFSIKLFVTPAIIKNACNVVRPEAIHCKVNMQAHRHYILCIFGLAHRNSWHCKQISISIGAPGAQHYS
jgi:hypothetical protein